MAGLFAGVGGIELGLDAAGHETTFLCEFDPGAAAVLRARFPRVEIHPDIRTLRELPDVDLLTAGFPCQDLSQAGKTAGIEGHRSGLVAEVFRLLRSADPGPRWVLLENVPFMLQLDRGRAMHVLTSTLESLGYRWAYRVVDARAFGIPQRRLRVLLLASRVDDPTGPLLGESVEPVIPTVRRKSMACGFYWTEGVRGLGWAVDAVPTLKGGSTVGVPSPPAIWMPDGSIVTPDLRDAERLQGFPADWTAPASPAADRRSIGHRWKLVGNAVSAPVATWIGRRLSSKSKYDGSGDADLGWHERWPSSAYGSAGSAKTSTATTWPIQLPYTSLASFLQFAPKPLSDRAARGFLARTERSVLRFPPGLLTAVQRHLARGSLAESSA